MLPQEECVTMYNAPDMAFVAVAVRDASIFIFNIT